jgi:hypothetical protein
MEATTYTLILTQGIHTVRPDVAATIRAALVAQEPLVEIDMDLFGGVDSSRRTTLATAHVVALAEAKAPRTSSEEQRGKVRRLR